MGTLRVKVKVKDVEIELEGDKQDVKPEWDDIKKNGLGSYLSGFALASTVIDVAHTTTTDRPLLDTDNEKPYVDDAIEGSEEENLPEFSIFDLVKSAPNIKESIWPLMYAYHLEQNNHNQFTIKDIGEVYRLTNRFTKQRQKNIGNSFKTLVSDKFISSLNGKDYILTDKGRKHALKIITGEDSVQKKNSKASASKPPSLVRDLNLTPSDNISFQNFVESKKINLQSIPELIVSSIYYLKNILDMSNVGYDHIYTCLRDLKIKIPPSINAMVRNVKSKNGWLDYESTTDIKCSIQGINFIEIDLQKRTDNE